MNWNKHGSQLDRQAQGTNPFMDALPGHRKILFRRAFGILGSKAPIRKPRESLDKNGKRQNPAQTCYQEDLIESRKFVDDIFEIWTDKIGYAQKSQVVHAFVTGSMMGLIKACEKNLLKAKQVKDGKQHPAEREWEPAIMEAFRHAVGLQTAHEAQKAGKDADAALAKLKEETTKVKVKTETKVISKAAKKMNINKAKKEAANVGA